MADGPRRSPSRHDPWGREIIARFGDVPPVGSNRAAARLAVRMGLDVERRDIEVLVAQGDLNVISSFRGHPVYLLEELDALDPGKVRKVVSARKGPLTETVDAGGAATIFGWPRRTVLFAVSPELEDGQAAGQTACRSGRRCS